MSAVIETGVDKLVGLVSQKNRVTLKEAAKSLGVSVPVIEEWADFLEEEGLISIDYSLANTYLVPRKLSGKEIEQKAKQFNNSKDAFVRKIDSTVNKLNQETKGFIDIREKFESLKKQMGSEMSTVKNDLKELERYEKLRTELDSEINRQKQEFNDKIRTMDKKLSSEKAEYTKIVDKIENEKRILRSEGLSIKSLGKKEDLMYTKIDEFNKMTDELKQQIGIEREHRKLTERNINSLKTLTTGIEKRIQEDRSALNKIISESRENEKKIISLQNQIVKKAQAKKQEIKNNIKESRTIARDFNDFFAKKNNVEELIKTMDQEISNMKTELSGLAAKAGIFSLSSKSTDVKKHMKELENKYALAIKNRDDFKKQMQKLVRMVRF